jgi:hypothetical protein
MAKATTVNDVFAAKLAELEAEILRLQPASPTQPAVGYDRHAARFASRRNQAPKVAATPQQLAAVQAIAEIDPQDWVMAYIADPKNCGYYAKPEDGGQWVQSRYCHTVWPVKGYNQGMTKEFLAIYGPKAFSQDDFKALIDEMAANGLIGKYIARGGPRIIAASQLQGKQTGEKSAPVPQVSASQMAMVKRLQGK